MVYFPALSYHTSKLIILHFSVFNFFRKKNTLDWTISSSVFLSSSKVVGLSSFGLASCTFALLTRIVPDEFKAWPAIRLWK